MPGWAPYWLTRKRVVVLGLACLVAMAAVGLLIPEGFNDVQALRPWTVEIRVSSPEAADQFLEGVNLDIVFALLYGAGLSLLAVGALAGRRPKALRAALGFVGLAVAADLLEGQILRVALERLADGREAGVAVDLADLPRWARAFGTLKWAAVIAGIAVIFWFVGRASHRTGTKGGAGASDHHHLPRPAPPARDAERWGICCSGGGTRSASFSLGALQALQASGDLEQAEYLAAASGGGYIAAGLVVSERFARGPGLSPEPRPDPPVFSPRSPETRWFRDHASYLLPDFTLGVRAVARLVGGLLYNVLIVWLVLFALARPVGWLISELHPERQTEFPIAVPVDPVPGVDVGEVRLTTAVQGDNGERVERWVVEVVPSSDVEAAQADFEVLPFGPHDTPITGPDLAFTVSSAGDGGESAIIEVEAGRASVARQPEVSVVVAPDATPCDAEDVLDTTEALVVRKLVRCSLEVTTEPSLGIDDDAVLRSEQDVRDQLRVEHQPRLASNSGLRDRPDITIDPWMWAITLSLLTAAALVSAFIMLRRVHAHWRTWLPHVLWVTAGVAFAVLIALPWMDQELFGGLNRVAQGQPFSDSGGSGSTGWQDVLVPVGGFLALLGTLLGRFFTSNQSATEGEAAKGSASWVGRLWAKLRGRNKELGWYELSATKILAWVLVVSGAAAVFVNHLQYASANGYDGRLMGTAFLRDQIDSRTWWPAEFVKFAAVVFLLVLLQRVFDAHANSIHPYYKQRLTQAFLLERDGGRAQDISYDVPVPFQSLEGYPELLLCCAVNLSEVGVTPPGRRAGSFTFSSQEVGGPLVGYCSYHEYWSKLPQARQKDLTIPSAMAISGAAFSPAMGKKNLGPVGTLFALANLRLGVWLPHPDWVRAANDGDFAHDRPGWSWFGREVLNRYQRDDQYVYVSDGGHWDNLGLVELLRRGCTRIVCINAGGDGQDSFGTIGEAMALAREELGVEFTGDFEPTDLRPPIVAAEGGRLLRRQESRDEASPLATESFVTGTYHFPDGRKGTIWLIEPALTADLPFDVHVYAEGEAIFPDDSTADLVYNHRQFEAFRALGYHQAEKLTADSDFKRS